MKVIIMIKEKIKSELRKWLANKGKRRAGLAVDMGYSLSHLNNVINETQNGDPKFWSALERVTGIKRENEK